MKRKSKNEYPPDWNQIATATKDAANWECIRCKHAHDLLAGYVLTVHHLDGDKANNVWWNLLALCQRCHLRIQGKVNLIQGWFLEHSDWFKSYVAGYYAHQFKLTEDKEFVMDNIDTLLERGAGTGAALIPRNSWPARAIARGGRGIRATGHAALPSSSERTSQELHPGAQRPRKETAAGKARVSRGRNLGFRPAGQEAEKCRSPGCFRGSGLESERLLFTLGKHADRTAVYLWSVVGHDDVSQAARSVLPDNAPFLNFEPDSVEDYPEALLDDLPGDYFMQESVEDRTPEEHGPQKWLILNDRQWQPP